MKKPRFSRNQIKIEHEISFSQSAIVFDILFGLALLVGGVALAYWIKSWAALFLPLLGLFSIWQAVKRGRNQGPQLKIGYSGIWTAKIGFLPWGKALPMIKREVGYRYVSEYLVIMNRVYPDREIARLSTRELDIDGRVLQAYLNQCASKQF